MGTNFPPVPLRRAIRYRKEFIRINDSKLYKRCRVQLHAKGIVLRDLVEGSEIKTKDQQICRVGDFLVAEIDAKVGGFGIVPKDLDGAIVSSHYFLFDIDETILDRQFLDFFIRTPAFSDQVLAKGSTNYAAIRPDDVLEYVIPLPSLDEQRRIVVRIDDLATRIQEAHGLRQNTTEKSATLLASVKTEVFNKASTDGLTRELDEVAPINMGQSPPGESYNKSGDGVPLLNGPTEFGERHPIAVQWTTAPTKLCNEGDILICVRGATTGRMNWADRKYCIGRGLAALTPLPEMCIPEYVYHFVETQAQMMLSLAAGSTFPNLPGRKLKALKIPILPISEQRMIVEYLDQLQRRVDALKRLHAETSSELDALLPSVLDKAFKGEL